MQYTMEISYTLPTFTCRQSSLEHVVDRNEIIAFRTKKYLHILLNWEKWQKTIALINLCAEKWRLAGCPQNRLCKTYEQY